MNPTPVRCLILACGNTLREDDGAGPWLAAWAAKHFASTPDVRILCSQQWMPELSEDIARAESVLFVDCASNEAPGSVRVRPIRVLQVRPAAAAGGLATHHLGPAELLTLSKDLYGSIPRNSLLLTVGAASMELREGFSAAVNAALPHATRQLTDVVALLLTQGSAHKSLL